MSYLLSAYAIILAIVVSYLFRVNYQCTKVIGITGKLGINLGKKSKLDSPGFRLTLISITLLLLLLGTYMSILWAPNAKGEPQTYRIIFFHISVAMMSYLGFFITFIGGILFLWKKELKYDHWARVGADLGVHFSMLMIISGMIWGRQRWGAWWVWEPRLTTALILLITYVGYLILRHVLDNSLTRARYAAVYGILAFLNVPLVHFAIKLWGSIMHPVIEKGGAKPGLSPDMALTLYFSQFVFLVTFLTMYSIRLRVESIESAVSHHRSKEKELD